MKDRLEGREGDEEECVKVKERRGRWGNRRPRAEDYCNCESIDAVFWGWGGGLMEQAEKYTGIDTFLLLPCTHCERRALMLTQHTGIQYTHTLTHTQANRALCDNSHCRGIKGR